MAGNSRTANTRRFEYTANRYFILTLGVQL